MIRKILLPVDFSETSLNAIEFALRLFGNKEVLYYLVNAYSLPQSASEMLISVNDILRDESEEKLENTIHKFRTDFNLEEETLKAYSFFGSVAEVVEHATNTIRPDFVVMGTKSISGIQKFFNGSKTAAAVRRAAAPVLLVPKGYKYRPFGNVVVANDNELHLDSYAYEPLHLLWQAPPEISVLNITVEPNTDKLGCVDCGLALGMSATYKSNKANSAVSGLNDFVSKSNSDLLIMISRKRGIMRSLFHSSSTQAMAMSTKVPLLVIREEMLTAKRQLA